MLRAIILDFDGVIADTEPLHYRAFAETLRDEAVMPSEAEYFHDYVGFNDATFLRTVFNVAGRPLKPDAVDALRRRKDQAYFSMIAQGLALLPGVESFVRRAARRWTLAICSGARRAEIETVLAHAGLRDVFRTIISADDAPLSKPDPSGFLMAIDELSKYEADLRPAQCLAIEDSLHGIRAAKAAGMKVLAVRPTRRAEAMVEADALASSLSAVTDEELASLFE